MPFSENLKHHNEPPDILLSSVEGDSRDQRIEELTALVHQQRDIIAANHLDGQQRGSLRDVGTLQAHLRNAHSEIARLEHEVIAREELLQHVRWDVESWRAEAANAEKRVLEFERKLSMLVAGLGAEGTVAVELFSKRLDEFLDTRLRTEQTHINRQEMLFDEMAQGFGDKEIVRLRKENKLQRAIIAQLRFEREA